MDQLWKVKRRYPASSRCPTTYLLGLVPRWEGVHFGYSATFRFLHSTASYHQTYSATIEVLLKRCSKSLLDLLLTLCRSWFLYHLLCFVSRALSQKYMFVWARDAPARCYVESTKFYYYKLIVLSFRALYPPFRV